MASLRYNILCAVQLLLLSSTYKTLPGKQNKKILKLNRENRKKKNTLTRPYTETNIYAYPRI